MGTKQNARRRPAPQGALFIDAKWEEGAGIDARDLADAEQCFYGAMAVAKVLQRGFEQNAARDDDSESLAHHGMSGLDRDGLGYALVALTSHGWMSLATHLDRLQRKPA